MSSSPPVLARRPEAVHAARIEAIAGLRALEAEWWDLWHACGASPFQSPAWLLPWWQHVGQGRLSSIAVRDGSGTLVGLAPLYVHEQAGRRHLFPLGIATTDRLDVLARPDHADAVNDAITAHLADEDGWDVFEAPQLAPEAALLQMRWPADWRVERAASDANPVLALPAALPPRMAQNLAYARRRAARAGAVRYELADDHSWPQLLEDLDRLHARRWALRDQAGVLRGSGVLDWHRAAMPRLLAHGLLRLLALRVDGHVVAVLYLLADAMPLPRRRWSYYIGGFDPAASALSPGTLLVGRAIELAQAEGCLVFDFLRGAEPYKMRWGAVAQGMWRLAVTRP